MKLHAALNPGHSRDRPCLVWLHGFLGSQQEWAAFSRTFTDWPQLWVDLPGHGGSVDIAANSFAEVEQLLRNTLLSYNILNYQMVGYSLGGRVAMYHACQGNNPGLCGLVVEGEIQALPKQVLVLSGKSPTTVGRSVFVNSRLKMFCMTGTSSPYSAR